MGKLTVQSLAKKIEQDNQLFENATIAEKRVIIAQDCLDRITFGQINPIFQHFCQMDYSKEVDYYSSAKDILNSKNDLICSACAKGSLFLSYVGRVNKVQLIEIRNNNEIESPEHKKLLEIFSARQLALIEMAYEGGQYIHEDLSGNRIIFYEKTVNKVESFREQFFSPEELLISICKNIIQNKGTFKI